MDSAFQQLLSEDSGMVRDGADGPTSARHTRSTRERLLKDYLLDKVGRYALLLESV